MTRSSRREPTSDTLLPSLETLCPHSSDKSAEISDHLVFYCPFPVLPGSCSCMHGGAKSDCSLSRTGFQSTGENNLRTRWLSVVWRKIFISFCLSFLMVSLILMCKHLWPLSSLNEAKVLKSLAVFKLKTVMTLQRVWEGLDTEKCLVTGPQDVLSPTPHMP